MNTIIIGGINTGLANLEPVAEAVVATGLSSDVDIFLFRDAMEDFRSVGRASRGARILTHSAGACAVSGEMSPGQIVTVAGPEPRSIGSLLLGAVNLTLNNAKKSVTGPHRREHFMTNVGKGVELGLHPVRNLRHLPAISKFSTAVILQAAHESAIDTQLLRMDQDEFFPLDEDKVHPSGSVMETIIDGYHDDLLVEPARILGYIKA